MSGKPDTTEKTARKPQPIETKDKWTILTLRSVGHVPCKIEPVALAGGNRILLYHFDLTAWTDYDSYMRGEPIPIADIRLVEQADREFKNNLHRFPS